jgi:YD repeat-containing protein
MSLGPGRWASVGWKTARSTPYQVTGVSGMTAIAAGRWHTLALETPRPGWITSYTFDGMYRVTSGGVPGFPTSYAYDSVGNRLTSTPSVASTACTYDKADRIQTVGGTTYTVDANGNLTSDGTNTYGYDQANHLISAVVGGTTSTYTYDGDGKRTKKVVGSTTTNYAYDANGSLPNVLTDGTLKYVYGLSLAYAVDGSGNVQVFHTDGLGSVRAITYANQNVLETFQADQFGVPGPTEGTSAEPFRSTGE